MKKIIAIFILISTLVLFPFSVMATESLDAKYETGDDADYTANSTVIWAQTFTALSTASFPYIDILIRDNTSDNCTGTLVVDLRTTTAGAPNGNAGELATASMDCSTLTTTAAWTRFTFGTPASLTSGTLYAIVATGGTSWRWRGDSTSPTYADGKLCYDNSAPIDGEAWSSCLTSDELMFRTYKTDAGGAVTTDEGALIIFGYTPIMKYEEIMV